MGTGWYALSDGGWDHMSPAAGEKTALYADRQRNTREETYVAWDQSLDSSGMLPSLHSRRTGDLYDFPVTAWQPQTQCRINLLNRYEAGDAAEAG